MRVNGVEQKKMNKVTIYTGENCSYCDAVKRTCEEKSFEYVALDVGTLSPMQWKAMAGFVPRSVPQVFVGEEYIGGASDFFEYIKGKS